MRPSLPDGIRRVAFWTAVVALAAAAVFYFITSLSWFDRPYPGFKLRIDRSVELQLPPGSTGARARLMPGDRVVAVDGRPLGDPRDLYAYVATRPIGTAITYDMERSRPDGREIRFTKTIATQAHDWRQWGSIFLAYWLTGVSFLVLGTVVLVLKPGDPLTRANMAFHFAGAAACLSIFDQSTSFLSPYQDPARLLQWVIAVFFTNLALQFPRRRPWLEGARRANLAIGLALSVVLVAAHAAQQGAFWVAFAHLGYIALGELILIANALAAWLGPRSTPSERGQGKALLVGTLVSTAPALIVPQAQALGLHIGFEGLENFALPLWPLAISYAIVRHRLFDISLLLKRSITYVLTASVLALIYVLVAGATQALLGSQTHLPGILTTALVALAFVPVRDRTKAWLDARFFRSPYRFSEVIGAFTRLAQESVEPQVLIRAYVQAIVQALAPTHCTLFLHRDRLQAVASHGLDEAACASLAPKLAPGATTLSWQGEALLLYPLAVQDQVLGYAVLGSKKSELAYTELDRALLLELTRSLAVWLNLFERFEKVRLQHQEIEALKRSEAMQGQFLNMVSHELKIPLSVIMGALSLLKRHESGLEVKVVSHHDRIRRSLTHLNGLVSDLLNASQLQNGHFRLFPVPLDLAQVAQESVAEMRGLAEQKGHSLALSVASELPPLHGDPTRLEQVFRNLLHNAIRYTPADGRIQLVVGAAGNQVRCEVRDNGPGIEPASMASLFHRFSQAHAGAPDRDQGVGLGLFIAKAIVEAHGGTIGVESQLGQGTTFWFTLPAGVERADMESAPGLRALP